MAGPRLVAQDRVRQDDSRPQEFHRSERCGNSTLGGRFCGYHPFPAQTGRRSRRRLREGKLLEGLSGEAGPLLLCAPSHAVSRALP
jgi:hypothetical protein